MATMKEQLAQAMAVVAEQQKQIEALLARKTGGQTVAGKYPVDEALVKHAGGLNQSQVAMVALGMEDIRIRATMHLGPKGVKRDAAFWKQVRVFCPQFEEHSWRDGDNSYQRADGTWGSGYYDYATACRRFARLRSYGSGSPSEEVEHNANIRIATVLAHLQNLASGTDTPAEIKATAAKTLAYCSLKA